jgi:glycosyl transferase family 25
MNELIHSILYINLSHRVDRKTQIEKELLKVFPVEKITRIDAVLDKTHGGKGCTKSHILALKTAISNNYKNCLIVEDDFIWNNLENSGKIAEKLIVNEYDVILFGSTFLNYEPKTFKVFSGKSRTGYLVNNHYYKKLLANFEESLSGFEKTNKYPVYAGDEWWKKLQKEDNWYAVVPVLCYQIEGYSDIQHKNQSYKHYSITK